MAVIYNRAMTVPNWVVVQEMEGQKSDLVIEWFVEHGARHVQWPSTTFKNTIDGFRKRGWDQSFQDTVPTLPPQLLVTAALEHMKMYGPNAGIAFNGVIAHRVNRAIRVDADYARIFDEFLEQQTTLALSQSFQIGEHCHGESQRSVLWVTKEPVYKRLLTVLADKVITVGESDFYNVNIVGAEGKRKISKVLEEKFQNFAKE